MKVYFNILIYLLIFIFSIAIYKQDPCFAENFGGVEFPQGVSSFADHVVSYKPTGGVDSLRRNAEHALGKPDYDTSGSSAYVSLGDEGILILQFTDNSLTTSGDDSLDLWIFEIGGAIEPTSIEISTDGVNWISIGSTNGSTSGIDIDEFIGSGVIIGERYSFVKIIDLLPHQSGSPTAGADIDAVGAISSAPPACNCEDSDNDGVINQWDECPNTMLNSYVDKKGCSPTKNTSAISGIINMKGQPLQKGSAMLIQSGEIHQKSVIENNGSFQFSNVAEEKPFSVIIRKKND